MLRCPRCGYVTDEGIRCPKCGLPLLVNKDGIKYRVLGNRSGIWRYSDMLPRVVKEFSLGEGYTPVRHVGKFMLKMEGRNPSGSYMDRGTAVWISYRRPKKVSLKMDGDFSRSIALYASRAGSEVSVSISKTDDARDVEFYAKLGCNLCIDCVKESSIKYGDPLMIEGYKTIAIELQEQVHDLDGIVVPVESGVLIYSIWHGMNEMLEMGAIDSIPTIIGARLLEDASTNPGNPIMEFLGSKGIKFMDVNSQDALQAVIQLTKIGIYTRPISAAAYVVASKIRNNYVAIITGSSTTRIYARSSSITSLQRELLQIINLTGKATAYQAWQRIRGKATLQGVYKALNSLVAKGLLYTEVDVKGKKRIIYFMAKNENDRATDA